MASKRIFFIAGTDTGVGKSVIAAAFASALALSGRSVGVMKPISCGGREDAYLLAQASGSDDAIDLINPIALKAPLSPNVAARLEGVRIDLRRIDRALRTLTGKYDNIIVEGCGGLLVPIAGRMFVIDLIKRMRAETILVSRSGLGAINHSLLSLEALRARRIEPLGVIFNRLSGGPESVPERTNPAVIAEFGRTRSLGVFPHTKIGCATGCRGKAFLKHIDLKKIL